MRLKQETQEATLGFQIAPMIDVVFVIMLFFMIMAGEVKIENEFNIKLPGTVEVYTPVNFVDEIIISIDKDGQVSLNDENVDSPTSHDMTRLKQTLSRLKQSSEAAKTEPTVLIVSDDDSKYGRTVDVLDALASVKITSVSFSLNESGE